MQEETIVNNVVITNPMEKVVVEENKFDDFLRKHYRKVISFIILILIITIIFINGMGIYNQN